MLTRRGFLGRLAGAFVAALAAPTLLELLPAPAAPPLAFRSDALGISMRFIEGWDMGLGQATRLDVLYGFGSFGPQWGCRVEDKTPLRAGAGFATYLEADRAIQESVRQTEAFTGGVKQWE